jgi:hypothetical protein
MPEANDRYLCPRLCQPGPGLGRVLPGKRLMKPSPDYGWHSIGMGRNNCHKLAQLTMHRKAALAWCPILKLFDVTDSIIRK